MPETTPLRWASVISGGGTTMEAMAMACKSGDLKGKIEPVAVIATREEAEGIAKAAALEIPVEVVSRRDFPKGEKGTEEFGNKLIQILRQYEPDVVTLNGCLVQMSPLVIEKYKMYNQHPGDPRFLGGKGMYGRRVHAAALLTNRFLRRPNPWTLVVAQEVNPKYDRGGVVKSVRVEIMRSDTVDRLQQRALPMEHDLQIALLHDIVEGTVKVIDQREPFIHPLNPWERVILYISREAGKALYPNG